jgi:hypothetical protein
MNIKNYFNQEFTTKTLGIITIDVALTKESHIAKNHVFVYSDEIADVIYISFEEFFEETGLPNN